MMGSSMIFEIRLKIAENKLASNRNCDNRI